MKFINPIIDYAHPMMMAEKGLKEAHNDLLEKKYDSAIEKLLSVSVEIKLAINSVKHIKEKK
jgi:hypothetical protein